MIWLPMETTQFQATRQNPRRLSMERSEALMKRAIADSQLSPGTYSITNPPDYKSLKYVQESLLERLVEEINGLDVLDLCFKLYRMHESMVSDSKVLSGSDAITVQALRSLVELAIKTCDNTGVEIGEDQCDYLLALAFQAIAWDSVWDQLNVQLFPQVIAVGSDFTLNPVLHDKAARARDAYTLYLSNRHRVREIQQDELPAAPSSSTMGDWFDSCVDNSDYKDLDECLVAELGYGLADYLKFVEVVTQSLAANGVLVGAFDCEDIADACLTIQGLDESVTKALLRDFTLSGDTIKEATVRDIFSVGRRKRDSRFVRRPILRLACKADSLLLCGFESVIQAGGVFLKEIQFGRIPVELWARNTKVDRAFGDLRGKVGEPFKQNIAKDCRKIVGDANVRTEKRAISGVRRKHNLGPVDIFIVDPPAKRFILAEVKNGAAAGMDPLAMKDESEDFFEEYLPILNRKTNWFRSNIENLKKEWEIPLDQHYSIEEVVVVNQQRPWVLSSSSPLPIMDDEEFLARLGRGDPLCTNPVTDCGHACVACQMSTEDLYRFRVSQP